MNLTGVSYYSRRVGAVALVVLILLVVIRLSIALFGVLINTLPFFKVPYRPPEGFGTLPTPAIKAIAIPQGAYPSFALDTPNGLLPQEPSYVNVYPYVYPYLNLYSYFHIRDIYL